jgi:putative transposase
MTAETRKQRLHRLDRLFAHSPIYFVTACTNQRREILATPSVHAAFVRFCEMAPERGAWVGGYVLMPDHLHLFVATDGEKISMANWMKSLKNTLSKTFRSQNIPSPHWQKTFFDHVLRNSESYTEKWNYVRENPVRARFVSNPEEWPFLGEVFRLEFGAEDRRS